VVGRNDGKKEMDVETMKMHNFSRCDWICRVKPVIEVPTQWPKSCQSEREVGLSAKGQQPCT
jgi:hypothetical protein